MVEKSKDYKIGIAAALGLVAATSFYFYRSSLTKSILKEIELKSLR